MFTQSEAFQRIHETGDIEYKRKKMLKNVEDREGSWLHSTLTETAQLLYGIGLFSRVK